jgi:N-acetylneuraminate synthase
VLLQCTTEYPSKLDNVGANIIEMFKKKYKCKVGLSDHTGTVFPSLFSISREYDYLEVHVDYKNSKNPDSSSSITFEDLKLICDYRDNFFKFKNQNIDKNNMPLKIKKLKKMFTKSIALKRNLDKGEAIEIENITLKKPGTGIPHSDLKKILGKSAKNKIYSFNLLKWSDVE